MDFPQQPPMFIKVLVLVTIAIMTKPVVKGSMVNKSSTESTVSETPGKAQQPLNEIAMVRLMRHVTENAPDLSIRPVYNHSSTIPANITVSLLQLINVVWTCFSKL